MNVAMNVKMKPAAVGLVRGDPIVGRDAAAHRPLDALAVGRPDALARDVGDVDDTRRPS